MSLRKRLEAGLGLAMAGVILLLALLTDEAIRDVGEDLVASRMRHDAESLLAALQVTAQGTLVLDDSRLGAIYDRPYTGHYYLIALLGDGQALRSRSLWDAPLAVPPLPPGETHRWHARGPDDQPLLVWAGGFRKQQRDVTIAVAEELGTLHAHLTRVRWLSAGIGVLVLLGVLGLQRMILRRSFDPLQQTVAEVERLAAGEIGQLGETVPEEVRPLVAEFNRLLRLLDRRLQRSRNAAGNLAHALKTPLALLGQLAGERELQAHPQLVAELNARLEQVRRIIESELTRARLAGRAGTARAFRPGEDLPQLVEVLQRIYADRAPAIELDCASDLVMPLDRDDALELIGNLLDNACKWARGRVRLAVVASDVQRLVVEDDGPGCTPERTEELTRRGTRLDETVAGHGLGLAIVREIAELYGAQLTFDSSSELGGLQVTVAFPPAARVRTPDCGGGK